MKWFIFTSERDLRSFSVVFEAFWCFWARQRSPPFNKRVSLLFLPLLNFTKCFRLTMASCCAALKPKYFSYHSDQTLTHPSTIDLKVDINYWEKETVCLFWIKSESLNIFEDYRLKASLPDCTIIYDNITLVSKIKNQTNKKQVVIGVEVNTTKMVNQAVPTEKQQL